jgi:alkylation response protein AidB-like acyl-CoA dehydrogenase
MSGLQQHVEVADTVASLEKLFGNPWDKANPCGFRAILEADEKGTLLPEGEDLLDRLSFSAEFIPVALGGRLHGLMKLIETGRSVFRHDPCLGLGHGASSLIAAVNVWTAGSVTQKQGLARLMLRNCKVACAYHELEHGNDLARVEFQAYPQGEYLMLNGRKQIISNIERADAIVIYARTSSDHGSRSHSQIFLEKSDLAAKQTKYAPRFNTVGMRGVPLGGIEIRDCPVEADSLIGSPGHGLETALKAFQVTRVALPGMFMGILDTGLRTALLYAHNRKLYGRTVLELPQVRGVLASAFVDLLLCDCFVTVVARSMHLTPDSGGTYSAAVKYLVPKLLIDAMTGLSAILGAQFYLRDGEYGIFQKLLRDLKPASFGHAGAAACQMTILPKLPHLARRSWLHDGEAPLPDSAFSVSVDLPAFSFDTLTIGTAAHDPLVASLVNTSSELRRRGTGAALIDRVQFFVDELRQLKHECATLSPSDLGIAASARCLALTVRYINVLAAAACLSWWWHNRSEAGRGQSEVDREPIWLLCALDRLRAPNIKLPPVYEPRHREQLLDELLQRYNASLSFDLRRQILPGWAEHLSTCN